MNLNGEGMPCQSNGDSLDTLNRVGVLALSDTYWRGPLLSRLEISPGVYVRHVGANPNNVSGDQLVPTFAAWMLYEQVVLPGYGLFSSLCIQLAKRLGFAQNTHDTDGTRKLLPDFLLHRVLPFIARVYMPKSAILGSIGVYLADTILFLNTLVTVIDLRVRNNPDHVDPFVNAVATLYAVNVYRPTYLSKLSARMLATGAISKTGIITEADALYAAIHPDTDSVSRGLAHYHRAASGGNPAVGEVQVSHWVETLKIARS